MLKIAKNVAYDTSLLSGLLKLSGCQKPFGILLLILLPEMLSLITFKSIFIGVSQLRNYKAQVNIEWVPPPKVPCIDPSVSGDKSSLPTVTLSRPQYRFARCSSSIDQLIDQPE